MPTYACSAAKGQLAPEQRSEIAKRLTAIHAEETGAPRYLVQVVFQELEAGSHYIAGQPASPTQIWVRADIRAGRTDAVKQKLLERILQAVSEVTEASKEDVWVYISDISAAGVAEYGRVLLPPGQEKAWLEGLPEALKSKLASLE